MSTTVPNHRLLAREHLAEATALADEGRDVDCRASLSTAAAHAIGRLAADHRLEAPSISRALAVLALRGVIPFDARPLWNSLLRDDEGIGRAADDPDIEELIAAVQVLVDLAAGVRAVPPSTAGRRRGEEMPDEDEDEDVAGGPLPLRGADWVRAVARDRARRRARRLRRLTTTSAFALALGLLGLGWSDAVEGTEHRAPKADIGFFDSGS